MGIREKMVGMSKDMEEVRRECEGLRDKYQ
jgi:hypothetical protein